MRLIGCSLWCRDIMHMGSRRGVVTFQEIVLPSAGTAALHFHNQGDGPMPLIAMTESKHMTTAKYVFTSE